MEEKTIKDFVPIREYSDSNYSKFSAELFNKQYRTRLGMYAQKLLFGLAASLGNDVDLFPTWEIPISGLFKYLNLSDENNERYKIVRDTIREIANTALEFEISDRNWRYLPWFNYADFDEKNSNYIHIEFSPKVKPYLIQLKNYCLLQAKYYINLSSDYSLWLYPLLRNVVNKDDPKLILSIDDIRKLTFNENTPTYDPKKNAAATKDLLKWVIGIEKKRGSVSYTPRVIAKKGKNVETGTIAEINDKTDLLVTCQVLKQGRSISHVVFNVAFKQDTFQGKRKAIRKAHRTLYSNQADQEARIEEIKANNLFETAIPISTVKELANSMGLTVKECLKKNGYTQVGDRAVKIK